ncbi:MAG TPA: retropepsin-like aspartic protease [Rubricoccaceae bacterium]|jgi:predicted aspartyl protease
MRTCVLAALFALSGCEIPLGGGPSRTSVPDDSAGHSVAFSLAGPGGVAVVVPVSVNGGPEVPFVLDTGATLTCIDTALADSLGLPRQPGVAGVGATISGAGSVGVVRADSFRVGAASAYDLPLCTVDLSALTRVGLEAEGLVGLNFLKAFRVGIDFEAERLTLERPE